MFFDDLKLNELLLDFMNIQNIRDDNEIIWLEFITVSCNTCINIYFLWIVIQSISLQI